MRRVMVLAMLLGLTGCANDVSNYSVLVSTCANPVADKPGIDAAAEMNGLRQWSESDRRKFYVTVSERNAKPRGQVIGLDYWEQVVYREADFWHLPESAKSYFGYSEVDVTQWGDAGFRREGESSLRAQGCSMVVETKNGAELFDVVMRTYGNRYIAFVGEGVIFVSFWKPGKAEYGSATLRVEPINSEKADAKFSFSGSEGANFEGYRQYVLAGHWQTDRGRRVSKEELKRLLSGNVRVTFADRIDGF